MKNPISSIKDKITQYIQLRFELIRLEVIEKLVNVMGYFIFTIIAIFLFFLTIFFIFLGIAEWFSQLLDSYTLGYLCTAGVILLCSIFVFVASKSIVRFFAGKLVAMLTNKKDDKADKSHAEDEE